MVKPLNRPISLEKEMPVPKYLVKEVIDGHAAYYKGYKDVINKTKKPEDIMPCSSLQFVIIDYLLQILYKSVDTERYIVATNEAGVHLELKTNMGNDIAIYDWEVLTPDKISTKYADVPSLLVVEVDIKEEVNEAESGMTIQTYIDNKVQKLLDFGTLRL